MTRGSSGWRAAGTATGAASHIGKLLARDTAESRGSDPRLHHRLDHRRKRRPLRGPHRKAIRAASASLASCSSTRSAACCSAPARSKSSSTPVAVTVTVAVAVAVPVPTTSTSSIPESESGTATCLFALCAVGDGHDGDILQVGAMLEHMMMSCPTSSSTITASSASSLNTTRGNGIALAVAVPQRTLGRRWGPHRGAAVPARTGAGGGVAAVEEDHAILWRGCAHLGADGNPSRHNRRIREELCGVR